MYKGTNEITNEGLGFKLINFMSFDESVFSAGLSRKPSRRDLHVRVNYAILSRNLHGKVLEDSRGHHAKCWYKLNAH
jgi:hypothetical protein